MLTGRLSPGHGPGILNFDVPQGKLGTGLSSILSFVNVPHKEHRVGGTTVVYLVIASHVEHSHVTFSNTKL